ncbi:Ankyrin repeat-containing domain protein [Niveomyces insectorum RCEF 264]|uniref:Ankyrin repeat-containing domain protein n=1 Tax=Niveomyces insectorum RCEF 264 TaxID=1081102 RepID=A0A167YY09_9HYPO|nr:Ankyrin repeat-containing domain protein [Niveomyces insectorum RCEF 264]
MADVPPPYARHAPDVTPEQRHGALSPPSYDAVAAEGDRTRPATAVHPAGRDVDHLSPRRHAHSLFGHRLSLSMSSPAASATASSSFSPPEQHPHFCGRARSSSLSAPSSSSGSASFLARLAALTPLASSRHARPDAAAAARPPATPPPIPTVPLVAPPTAGTGTGTGTDAEPGDHNPDKDVLDALAAVVLDAFYARAYAAHGGGTGGGAGDDTAAVDPAAAAAADEATRALLDSRDGKGCCTPLHVAAGAGATDAVRHLLQRGAELDAVDDLGRTPLHMAARYGRTETAAYLGGSGGGREKGASTSLWAGADSERLAELGDAAFIAQFLRDLVARETKQTHRRGHGQDGGDGVDDEEKGGAPARAKPTATPAFSRGSATDVVDWATVPASTPGHRRRRPTAAAAAGAVTPAAVDPPFLPPFNYRWELPPMLSEHQQQRTGRPLPPSMLQSGEYRAWRDSCETLLAEHRAQKEHNRHAGLPDSMLVG